MTNSLLKIETQTAIIHQGSSNFPSVLSAWWGILIGKELAAIQVRGNLRYSIEQSIFKEVK
jgi:hypothetical protein